MPLIVTQILDSEALLIPRRRAVSADGSGAVSRPIHISDVYEVGIVRERKEMLVLVGAD